MTFGFSAACVVAETAAQQIASAIFLIRFIL